MTAAAFVAVVFVASFLGDSGVTPVLFTFALLVLYIGVAIVKYRLYEIDVFISKAVVLGVDRGLHHARVSASSWAWAPSSATDRAPLLSGIAAAIVAVAFQPVRQIARRLANQLVCGGTRDAVRGAFGVLKRAAGTYSTEDVLPRMVQIPARPLSRIVA